MQLRFTLLTVTSSQQDLHPQVCAHAGRTTKKPPPGGGCCANANQAVASDLQLTLHSFVVVVLQAILVAHHLAVQLVYEFIHSSVQV